MSFLGYDVNGKKVNEGDKVIIIKADPYYSSYIGMQTGVKEIDETHLKVYNDDVFLEEFPVPGCYLVAPLSVLMKVSGFDGEKDQETDTNLNNEMVQGVL